MNLLALTVFAVTLLSSVCPAAAQQGWKHHTFAEWGIKVALPTKPQRRELPISPLDGTLTQYQSIEDTSPATKYSVFVGAPERQGIFEASSMDAFLSSHITTMVQATEAGKLLRSSRTTFHGRPALEYEFSHRLEGIAYIGRGVILMVDGGHMRLSMWHATNDVKAEAKYRRFIDSFELVPLKFFPASSRFTDPRGIAFNPPIGWLSRPGSNPVHVVSFTNLTRSLKLLVAGEPTYTCDNFLAEVRATGRLKEAGAVKLAKRDALRILSFEDVPKYNVRLTVVQYCQNSRVGAVVLGGSEDQSMFARWAGIYEGAAATVIRKNISALCAE